MTAGKYKPGPLSFRRVMREVASTALTQMALEAADYAAKGMQRIPPRITKAGIFFGVKKRGGKRVWPGAPPGTFPAVRTSNLRNSMTFAASTPETLASSFGVYSGRKGGMVHRLASIAGTRGYAAHLQFGTRGARGMKARPWATLTLQQAPLSEAFQRGASRRWQELVR